MWQLQDLLKLLPKKQKKPECLLRKQKSPKMDEWRWERKKGGEEKGIKGGMRKATKSQNNRISERHWRECS